MNNFSKFFLVVLLTALFFTEPSIAKISKDSQEEFSKLSECEKSIINTEAKKIFALCKEEAEKNNNTNAQFIFGKLYFEGTVTKQDYQKAKEWFEKAKDNGSPDAISALGTMYFFGTGVDLSTIKAVEYFKEAAEKNSPDGQMRYATMLLLGQGGLDKDTEKAREYYIKSARKGNAMALFHLGYIYFEGIGVKPDYQKAYIYFSAASYIGKTDEVSKIMGKLNERIEGLNRADLNKKAQKYIDKYIKPNMPGSDEYKEKLINDFSAISSKDE